MKPFAHLHLHSEYSLLDGACRIKDIVEAAVKCGCSSVAITDHGVLYGAVAFWRECRAHGIRPIIGCEVYVAQRSRFSKEGRADLSGNHLVLLAENETGYQNLIKLVSLSFTEGFYGKPRIDMELLSRHHQGLIALSACMAGYIPRQILSGDMASAERYAVELNELFGQGNFFLELQNHGLSDDLRICSALRRISENTGIPTVVTNDVHYISRRDARTHAVLMCVQTSGTLSDGRPSGFETDEFYFKTPDEMYRLFPGDTEALENTEKIAQRCLFDFTFGELKLPAFPQSEGTTHREMLYRLTYDGFERRQKQGEIVFDSTHTEKDYRDRIEYELGIIATMGFVDYYLIVSDFVRYAKTHGIPVGPGRGSGAGSLVAYCIFITEVDSLRFDLLFERFLNPERISMPDFDIDFCFEKRDLVIEYVKEKYGTDHVAQIITFGTLQAKAAIRDVARVMGISYSDADRAAKLIPPFGHTISDCLKLPEFRALYESGSEMRDLIDTAAAVEGMPRHASTHAAGVVITEKPVMEYVPLSVSGGAVVAAYDMNTLADLGLVKFDFLGLRYLTVLDRAEKNVCESGAKFKLSEVPFDDPATYKMLSCGITDGVFQLESAGIRAVLTQLKPDKLEDIIACIALYRPGPMESIGRFISCKNGEQQIAYDTPLLEPILKNTYGCIVYQEQVMQIFRLLAGYSYAKADLVRRAMSKKKSDVMEAERQNFLAGCSQRGISEDTAEKIFDDMTSFAKYAFNKSHATAYAFIAYRTAYMKAHHPAAYAAALLTAQQTTDITKCSVKILPPHINESRIGFSVSGDSVRYGLGMLKNIGSNFAQSVVDNRSSSPYRSFADFVRRLASCDLNRRQVESLIRSGAFDCFGVPRSALLAVSDTVIDNALRISRTNVTGQLDLFSLDPQTEYEEVKYPDIPEFGKRELLRMEKEITGICFSGKLLDEYSSDISRQHSSPLSLLTEAEPAESDTSERIYQVKDGDTFTACAIITHKSVKKTRNGEPMAFLTVEDSTAQAEVIVFPKLYETASGICEADTAVLISGRVSIREDESPKLIAAAVRRLEPNQSPKEEKKETQKTARLVLKLPGINSREMTQVLSLLRLYSGDTEVLFFDAKTKKYSRIEGCRVRHDTVLDRRLREILGDPCVCWQL